MPQQRQTTKNIWTAPPQQAVPAGHPQLQASLLGLPQLESMHITTQLGYLMQSAKNLEAADARIESSVQELQSDVDSLQKHVTTSFSRRKEEQDGVYKEFSVRLTGIEQRLREDEAEMRGRWAMAKVAVSIVSGAAAVVGWAVGTFLKF